MTWSTSNRRERLPENWPALRKQVFRIKGRLCALRYAGCQTEATEVDHITPGDDHSLGNLQPACASCHAQKSALEGRLMRDKIKAARYRRRPRPPGWRPLPKGAAR